MPTGHYKRTPDMYITRRGRKLSDEHKEKIALAHKGRKYPGRGKGRKLSDEQRRQIGNVHRGKVVSNETRAKQRAAHLGRPMSEGTRKALAAANKGGNRGSFKKGYVPQHKGKPLPQISNELNHWWKGDHVSYAGLHAWVRRKLGKPQYCECCHSTTAKRYEWANISRQYERDLSDWVRLCKSCHLRFDGLAP